ncbi:hypothetical protein F4778DRAFT_724803 [Xylariomycetidae sp. FL2044]|nr:hypothetical protein F4778DRAFT_724803 [Xylariomycetidae sp. FL2044]
MTFRMGWPCCSCTGFIVWSLSIMMAPGPQLPCHQHHLSRCGVSIQSILSLMINLRAWGNIEERKRPDVGGNIGHQENTQ